MTAARSGAIDGVRVLALAAVVVGHVFVHVRPVHVAVFAWHVPVFFVLTGLLWRPGRSALEEARRRARSLAVPWAVWTAVLLGAYALMPRPEGPPSWSELGGIALGPGAIHRPFHTLWFLPALLVAAVLHRPLSRLPMRVQLPVAAAGLVAGTVAGPVLAATPWSVGTVVFCLPFVVAGAALRPLLPRIAHPAATGLALIAGGAVLLLLGAAPVDLKAGDLGTPVLGVVVALVIPAGLVLAARAVSDRLPDRIARAASALALPAVVVLLLHPVVLWMLRTPGSGRPLDLVLCLLLPWAVGLAVVRSPVAPVLAGVPRSMARREAG